MALNLTTDCTFTGPALPEPFVKFNLETDLNRLALLPKTTGAEGRALDEQWQFIRRKLAALVSHGGGMRVQNHVIEPLLPLLGYARIETVEDIPTREGEESGGALLLTADGAAKLRVWCVDLHADLDAPSRRGLAYQDAPRQCLAAFDELQQIGLAAFTQKHDPYWDIPLNENLPQPVIDLPLPEPAKAASTVKSQTELFNFEFVPASAGSGKLFTEEAVPPKQQKGSKS
jgi:hypothetical protein